MIDLGFSWWAAPLSIFTFLSCTGYLWYEGYSNKVATQWLEDNCSHVKDVLREHQMVIMQYKPINSGLEEWRYWITSGHANFGSDAATVRMNSRASKLAKSMVLKLQDGGAMVRTEVLKKYNHKLWRKV